MRKPVSKRVRKEPVSLYALLWIANGNVTEVRRTLERGKVPIHKVETEHHSFEYVMLNDLTRWGLRSTRWRNTFIERYGLTCEHYLDHDPLEVLNAINHQMIAEGVKAASTQIRHNRTLKPKRASKP